MYNVYTGLLPRYYGYGYPFTLGHTKPIPTAIDPDGVVPHTVRPVSVVSCTSTRSPREWNGTTLIVRYFRNQLQKVTR